jgi:hypothetical protein
MQCLQCPLVLLFLLGAPTWRLVLHTLIKSFRFHSMDLDGSLCVREAIGADVVENRVADRSTLDLD